MTFEQPAVAIVADFANLLQEGNLDAASHFFDDSFVVSSPSEPTPSSINKEEWLKMYRANKKRPTYEAPEAGQHEKQVTRKGKMKAGPMMTVNLVQTFELNDDGKIVKIDMSKV